MSTESDENSGPKNEDSFSPEDPTKDLRHTNGNEEKPSSDESKTSGQSPLTPGETIGPYEVLEKIGEGGMAVVFRARDRKLDRDVALKVLRGGPDPADDKTRKRFVREAQSAAQINHQNVVHVYAGGKDQEQVYMAMELVAGETLEERLHRKGALPVKESLRIAREIAEALKEAHHHGIIHRDIKPGNVMIDGDDTVKVADFGLSRSITRDTRLTREGTYLGTPSYSSPEQCESKNVDERSDLYSLGAVVYEMLTGEVPIEADTPFSTMKKICEAKPRPVDEINSEIPESVARFVEYLLKKDPDERYQSADQVLDVLDHLVETNCSANPGTIVPGSDLTTREDESELVSADQSLSSFAVPVIILSVALCGIFYFSFVQQTADQSSPPSESGGEKAVTRLAALDFSNRTNSESLDWMELGLPDMISARINQLDRYRFTPRIKIKRAIAKSQVKKNEEKENQSDRRIRLTSTVEQILRNLNVDLFLKGKIYRGGDQSDKIRIVLQIFRYPEIRNEGSLQIEGSSDDIFSAVDDLTKELERTLEKVEGKPTGIASAETTSSKETKRMSSSRQRSRTTNLAKSSAETAGNILNKKYLLVMNSHGNRSRNKSVQKEPSSVHEQKATKKAEQSFGGTQKEEDRNPNDSTKQRPTGGVSQLKETSKSKEKTRSDSQGVSRFLPENLRETFQDANRKEKTEILKMLYEAEQAQEKGETKTLQNIQSKLQRYLRKRKNEEETK